MEEVGYLGVAFWREIIPSNPLIAMYQFYSAGFGAIPGYVGFDKIEVTDDTTIDSLAYIHHFHHKYFEVSVGDGLIPFDRRFGAFHDGSKEGEERMNARYHAKEARIAARIARAEGKA